MHRKLTRYIAQHPFLTASLAVHILILTILFYIGSYKIDQAVQARDQLLINTSMQELRRAEMASHVDAISAMKKLMEKNSREQSKTHPPSTDGNKATPGDESAESPKKLSPQELLNEAKELAVSMQTLERKSKAAELAALLKIPEEEALKKVDIEKLPPLPDKVNATKEDQVASAITAYEKIAGNVLKRELARKEKQENGTGIDMSGKRGSGSHESGSDGLEGDRKGDGGGRGTNGTGSRSDGSGTELFEGTRSFDGYRRVLAIDPAGLRKAGGRVVGKDGTYATRIILDSWYLIGPFPAKSFGSVNVKFPPEKLIDLDGVYFGKNNRAVKWRYVQSDSYPIVPPGEPEGAVYYGYTELMLDRDRDLWVALGADEDAKVWLNDKQVWSSVEVDKEWYRRDYRSMNTHLDSWNLTEENRLLHFRKGRNKILFKLYNAYGVLFFSFVIANT